MITVVVPRSVSAMMAAVAGLLVLSSAECVLAAQKPKLTQEVAPPGSAPYATTFTISVPSGSGANGFSPDPIPADRRLVIEFVSASVILQPSEKPLFSLDDSIGGVSHTYVLPVTFVQSYGIGDLYRVTQMVKLYYDGNGVSGPSAQCSRDQNSFAPLECSVTISGYLIPK
jgi:hypothetical protein